MEIITNGQISITTPPALEPLTYAEAKKHLRVDSDDEQTLIESLIIVARILCENFQRRKYIQTVLKFSLDSIPGMGQEIKLPFLPVISVDSVEILQTGTSAIVIPASQYDVDLIGGRVKLNSDYDSTEDSDLVPGYNGFEINLKIGYGTLASTVPLNIKQAMLLMIGLYFENREQATDGREVKEIPLGAIALLQQNRVF